MGAAQSNRTTSALSENSIETALVAYADILDGKGEKIFVRPDLLIVPNELEKESRILLESTGRTGTDYTNEINPYFGKLDIFVYHWLTKICIGQLKSLLITGNLNYISKVTRGKQR